MKHTEKQTVKIDLFAETSKKVKNILDRHNIVIDYEDDDKFFDFISGYKNLDMSLHEIQVLFFYNTMLQTMAFSLDDYIYTMEIKRFEN